MHVIYVAFWLFLNLNFRLYIEATSIKDSVQVDTGFCHMLLPGVLLESVRRRLESIQRHTATDLSRTVVGQEDNTGTTAHAGTSVFALGRQL